MSRYLLPWPFNLCVQQIRGQEVGLMPNASLTSTRPPGCPFSTISASILQIAAQLLLLHTNQQCKQKG